MREWAVLASTASLVEEMKTEWRTFRCRIVGEGTRIRSIRAVALEEVPADGDLRRVMLIETRKTTIA
jgi:hypothetical protein